MNTPDIDSYITQGNRHTCKVHNVVWHDFECCCHKCEEDAKEETRLAEEARVAEVDALMQRIAAATCLMAEDLKEMLMHAAWMLASVGVEVDETTRYDFKPWQVTVKRVEE